MRTLPPTTDGDARDDGSGNEHADDDQARDVTLELAEDRVREPCEAAGWIAQEAHERRRVSRRAGHALGRVAPR